MRAHCFDIDIEGDIFISHKLSPPSKPIIGVITIIKYIDKQPYPAAEVSIVRGAAATYGQSGR